MKYKWDKKYLYWGITAFCVIIAAQIAGGIISSGSINLGNLLNGLWSALTPLVYGFAIAYLLNPVENFFEKGVFLKLCARRREKNDPTHGYGNEVMIRDKNRARVFGVICAMLTLVLVVVGIIGIILPQLISTIQKLINNMQGYVDSVTGWVNDQLANYPEAREWINNNLDTISDAFVGWLTSTISPANGEGGIMNILSNFSSGIFTVAQVFMNIFIGLVVAVYFLFSKELFAAQLKKALYSLAPPKYGNAIVRNLRTIHRTFGSFLSGKIIDSLIIMLLFFIILSLFNFPYAILCSVFMGVFNIIPMFGPIIGAVPCALLILLEDPLYCLYFIIVVVVIQQLDGNVIGPKVLGESTGLSSFWIIFALLLGQSLFGFVGLIIGIPLFAVIYSIIRTRVGKMLEKKGLPGDSNVYRKVAYVDEETGELITLYEVNQSKQILEEKQALQKQARHGTIKRRFTKKHHKKQ